MQPQRTGIVQKYPTQLALLLVIPYSTGSGFACQFPGGQSSLGGGQARLLAQARPFRILYSGFWVQSFLVNAEEMPEQKLHLAIEE